MTSRRTALVILACGTAAGAVAGAALSLRWHRRPARRPFLTDAHLNGMAMPPGDTPRVLFIGNSMTLRHNLPGRVAALAAAEGRPIRVAIAAAEGAWLVETLRIETLKNAMRPGQWEALVLQDFTKAPLRPTDRLGSARAMTALAARVDAPVVLFPPWPAQAHRPVYRERTILLETPADPEAFARITRAHYAAVADRIGARVAPVPERWLAAQDGTLYAADGHHPSRKGTDFAARVIWETLRTAL